MAGGMHGRGSCLTRGMHGRGHAWQGHTWQGACMAGGIHAMHAPSRYYEIQSMSGWYISSWNALLFWHVVTQILFKIHEYDSYF